MLRDADAAMYAAKVKGPGRVEVFDEAASHRSMDRLDLRSELPRALDNGQLSVHYQPIVDMPTGTIAAFEALLRWNHPQRGLIPPDVFIPIAEETGALVPIGAWVLEQACRQLARWRRLPQGRALRISVNVSATQLAQPDLAEVALAAISRAGISPDDLWLEVTEHERVGDDLTEPVAALRDAGAHFSLDDFGMSYSNLSYLQRFPIEGIKVDRSFVAGIAEREADRGIVRAILAIADSLGLVVIAEGVETVRQRDTLIELGCPLGQGYLMSRPLSAAGATALLMTPPSTVDR
jgi:EAL domain-containing protein (putative c-di-GMP-specific phosphodiesterase class I)